MSVYCDWYKVKLCEKSFITYYKTLKVQITRIYLYTTTCHLEIKTDLTTQIVNYKNPFVNYNNQLGNYNNQLVNYNNALVN